MTHDLDPLFEIIPCAWKRVGTISKECTGVFQTEDVELRTERMEPLYDKDAIIAAFRIGFEIAKETKTRL